MNGGLGVHYQRILGKGYRRRLFGSSSPFAGEKDSESGENYE